MKRFKHWLSRGTLVVFGMLFAGSFCIPQAFAANTCECFCGDQTVGAVDGGAFGSTNECAQFCADMSGEFGGTVYVGCFTDEAFYPEKSNLCWTQTECSTYTIDIPGATTAYKGTWGGQNAYCSKEAVTGAQMGYCYGPMLPVVLNVPILGVKEISALGEYVNLLYTYAIPLAGLLGVLMFTVAGFQYMTAGGDKGAVSKAKARMSNTVMGIVLLMSVYTVAYLIDPRLTRFNELRPPLVKEAVLVDNTTTCEALMGYGFDISPTSGACGEKGQITGDNGLDLNIANPPKVGAACLFSGCTDASKSCILKGDKSGGQCIACDEVSALHATLGIAPSEEVCSQIATRAQERTKSASHKYVCTYDDDFSDLTQTNGVGSDECVKFSTGGDEYINCDKLKEIAAQNEDGCDAYEEGMNASSFGLPSTRSFVSLFNFGTADQNKDFKQAFASLCEQDICSIANAGTVPQGGCSFADSSYLQDVLGTALLVFNVFENYGCVGNQTQ